MERQDLVILTADIVAAHVANNRLGIGDIGQLVSNVHGALAGLGKSAEPAPEPAQPKVSARSSVKPDYLVCMECGAKATMLKRHLATAHDLTHEAYRDRYGLAATYPMVAPNYSEKRRNLAKSIGLGRKPADGKPRSAGRKAASRPARPPRATS